ncbi:MAG: ATP-binding cassette domain-containing protein [Burkholderiaceae bacterium]|nr:ATP-binding cassette domain-containing protein [Microbacteriaceae bacterium]
MRAADLRADVASAATSAPGLSARGITVAIAGRAIVDAVDADIRSGMVTAIVGPNGAGKSTLIRVLAGVDRPTAGTVVWQDRDWFGLSRRARARIAALVEQDSVAELPLTVRMAVALGRTPHADFLSGVSRRDEEITDDAMRRAGVAGFARRQISTLSGGERQRVNLARALAQDPRLLLLDEPTNHLDVRAQLTTLALARSLARDEGLAVVAALHDLNHAITFADDIVVLDGGRLAAAGAPRDILTPELIARVWGVHATVLTHPRTGMPVIAFDLPPDNTSDPLENS